jgi:hypothetical protein
MGGRAMYKVVWPSGQSTQPPQALAPRLDTLEDKTICGLSNGRYYFAETWPLIKKLLLQKYPGIKFVDWEKFDIIPDKDEGAVLRALPEKLRKYGCDAVISGRGC